MIITFEGPFQGAAEASEDVLGAIVGALQARPLEQQPVTVRFRGHMASDHRVHEDDVYLRSVEESMGDVCLLGTIEDVDYGAVPWRLPLSALLSLEIS